MIKKYPDNHYYISGVFCDFQKAFDTVNHNILLKNPEYYGARGLTITSLDLSLKIANNILFSMEFYQKSNQLHRVFFKDLLSVHYIFNTLMTYNVCSQGQSSNILLTMLNLHVQTKN